jgi:nucleotide-binding universal stress UspA family protein
MFRRILVPVDFTPRNQRAVRVAARLASSAKAETTLLHVIERIDTDAPGSLTGFYQKLEKNARRKLAELLEEFPKKGLDARAEVLYGSRVNEILRFAGENRIDLIVMNSHKLPLRGGENWGTISYKVGILSRCPVMLVK